MARDASLPTCPLCTEVLGSYGGPCTLPCGHNACVHCASYLKQRQPQCPLCRAPFPPDVPLAVNCELRELMRLAQALTATPVEDDWQAVHSSAKVDLAALKGGGGGSGRPAPAPAVGPLDVLDGSASVMELHPQPWQPDSSSGSCRAPGCAKPFSFLLRPRHHCRCCGELFCGACTADRLLLPPKFQLGEPQRVCASCAALLAPIQPLLAGSIAPAVRPPVHDVHDATALRSLLNPPLSSRLDTDIYTATNIVRAFMRVGSLPSEAGIPPAILASCAGLAVLSVARVSAGWSLGVGSGLVVARAPGGGWSPPSALLSLSSSVGWQVGVEVQDLVLVLRSRAAVAAFAASQLGVGGSAGLAAGPVGRAAAATALASRHGGALVYSYSSSRGAYAGVALEGTLLATRDGVNQQFYGRKVSAHQLLLGSAVPPPPAAAALYAALDELLAQAGGCGAQLLAAPHEEAPREGLPPPAVAASAPQLPLPATYAAPVASEGGSSDEDEWDPEPEPAAATAPAAPHRWGRGSDPPSPRGRALYPPLALDDEPPCPYGALFD